MYDLRGISVSACIFNISSVDSVVRMTFQQYVLFDQFCHYDKIRVLFNPNANHQGVEVSMHFFNDFLKIICFAIAKQVVFVQSLLLIGKFMYVN